MTFEILTVVLGVACFVLAMLWRDERDMRKFWYEQWCQESQFVWRLLGLPPPKLRVIRGGKR